MTSAPDNISEAQAARAEFFDADKMAARLMAGETPVLHTGRPIMSVLTEWMVADGSLVERDGKLIPVELADAPHEQEG